MSTAVWVRAVRVSAELALVALHADTLAVLTVTVSTAVRHLALLVPEVIQVSLFLPTVLNITQRYLALLNSTQTQQYSTMPAIKTKLAAFL